MVIKWAPWILTAQKKIVSKHSNKCKPLVRALCIDLPISKKKNRSLHLTARVCCRSSPAWRFRFIVLLLAYVKCRARSNSCLSLHLYVACMRYLHIHIRRYSDHNTPFYNLYMCTLQPTRFFLLSIFIRTYFVYGMSEMLVVRVSYGPCIDLTAFTEDKTHLSSRVEDERVACVPWARARARTLAHLLSDLQMTYQVDSRLQRWQQKNWNENNDGLVLSIQALRFFFFFFSHSRLFSSVCARVRPILVILLMIPILFKWVDWFMANTFRSDVVL